VFAVQGVGLLALLPCVFVLWFVRLVFGSVTVHKRTMAMSCLMTLLCLGPFLILEKLLLYIVVVKVDLPGRGGLNGEGFTSSLIQVLLMSVSGDF
jgi:hypothetical protein